MGLTPADRTLRQPKGVRAALVTAALIASAAPSQAQTYAYEHIEIGARPMMMDRSGTLVAGMGGPAFLPSIWRNGQRHVVDDGFLWWEGISADGWVLANTADLSSVPGAPAIFRWNGASQGFDRIDLGAFADLQDTIGAGIDDQNRVFGYGTNRTSRPADKIYRPFVWTEAGGLQDLAAMGYPPYPALPEAVSPGGLIATTDLTYQFGNPGSVQAVSPPPAPYAANSATNLFVNDDGVRAGFLRTVDAGITYFHLARYQASEGAWHVIAAPAGPSVLWDGGGLTAAGDITATVGDPGPDPEMGVRAAGPDGIAEDLSAKVSPAYGAVHIDRAAGEADDGSILVSMNDLMGKLVPVTACSSHCLQAAISVSVRVSQPNGNCTGATNRVNLRVKVTDENRSPVAGATVAAWVFDGGERRLTATTNSRGTASLRYRGPGCVGPITGLVDSVSAGGATLDRTVGTLAATVVP